MVPVPPVLVAMLRAHVNACGTAPDALLFRGTFATLSSDRRTASQKFFEWAGGHINAKDPAGHSGNLSSYMTWYSKAQFQSLLDSSNKRAKKAIEAERFGNLTEALRLWRIIYGPEFPAG